MFKTSSAEKQLQTIEIIKKMAEDLQQQEQSQFYQDSLAISESRQSDDTIKISVKPQKKSKHNKYFKKYVSPYKQHQISIEKIEATGRRRINPKVSFSNTLLQMATNDPRPPSRKNSQSSRYRCSPSLLEKIELSALDRLRTEARQMHQIQQRQKKQIPPNQRNKVWADFLLRERKWQQQKKAKEVSTKQEALLKQRKQNRSIKREMPREVQGITRQNMIRKIKRQRGKLQQQLNSISIKSFQWKDVNIRGQKSPPKPQQNRVRVSHSKQAAFLIGYRS